MSDSRPITLLAASSPSTRASDQPSLHSFLSLRSSQPPSDQSGSPAVRDTDAPAVSSPRVTEAAIFATPPSGDDDPMLEKLITEHEVRVWRSAFPPGGGEPEENLKQMLRTRVEQEKTVKKLKGSVRNRRARASASSTSSSESAAPSPRPASADRFSSPQSHTAARPLAATALDSEATIPLFLPRCAGDDEPTAAHSSSFVQRVGSGSQISLADELTADTHAGRAAMDLNLSIPDGVRAYRARGSASIFSSSSPPAASSSSAAPAASSSSSSSIKQRRTGAGFFPSSTSTKRPGERTNGDDDATLVLQEVQHLRERLARERQEKQQLAAQNSAQQAQLASQQQLLADLDNLARGVPRLEDLEVMLRLEELAHKFRTESSNTSRKQRRARLKKLVGEAEAASDLLEAQRQKAMEAWLEAYAYKQQVDKDAGRAAEILEERYKTLEFKKQKAAFEQAQRETKDTQKRLIKQRKEDGVVTPEQMKEGMRALMAGSLLGPASLAGSAQAVCSPAAAVSSEPPRNPLSSSSLRRSFENCIDDEAEEASEDEESEDSEEEEDDEDSETL